MKSWKNVIQAVCFMVLLGLAFIKVQGVFKTDAKRAYTAEQGFLLEKPNTLDAVYIGASNVHAFWQPPIGWSDYGIAVLSYSVDSLPFRAIKYMIIEARKTQPDALYIINLNGLKNMTVTIEKIHPTTDYLPFSINKIRMIRQLCEDAQIYGFDRLEFYLPIIRFHERWSTLKEADFFHVVEKQKMGLVNATFATRIQDVSASYLISEETTEMTPIQHEALQELLEYCDLEKLNVLFITVPQATGSMIVSSQLDEAEQYVRDRGYVCLDLLEKIEEMGIQTETDFYNDAHTNVHGSLKFCAWLGQYLVDHYGFTDKRGQKDWESWDLAAELYTDYIGLYTLPFERNHENRDYSLSAPIMKISNVNATSVQLVWAESKGAERYEIYRKSTIEMDGYWHLISEVDADILRYIDEGLSTKTKYSYTVVPVRMNEDYKVYGNYSFTGVDAVTQGD